MCTDRDMVRFIVAMPSHMYAVQSDMYWLVGKARELIRLFIGALCAGREDIL